MARAAPLAACAAVAAALAALSPESRAFGGHAGEPHHHHHVMAPAPKPKGPAEFMFEAVIELTVPDDESASRLKSFLNNRVEGVTVSSVTSVPLDGGYTEKKWFTVDEPCGETTGAKIVGTVKRSVDEAGLGARPRNYTTTAETLAALITVGVTTSAEGYPAYEITRLGARSALIGEPLGMGRFFGVPKSFTGELNRFLSFPGGAGGAGGAGSSASLICTDPADFTEDPGVVTQIAVNPDVLGFLHKRRHLAGAVASSHLGSSTCTELPATIAGIHEWCKSATFDGARAELVGLGNPGCACLVFGKTVQEVEDSIPLNAPNKEALIVDDFTSLDEVDVNWGKYTVYREGGPGAYPDLSSFYLEQLTQSTHEDVCSSVKNMIDTVLEWTVECDLGSEVDAQYLVENVAGYADFGEFFDKYEDAEFCPRTPDFNFNFKNQFRKLTTAQQNPDRFKDLCKCDDSGTTRKLMGAGRLAVSCNPDLGVPLVIGVASEVASLPAVTCTLALLPAIRPPGPRGPSGRSSRTLLGGFLWNPSLLNATSIATATDGLTDITPDQIAAAAGYLWEYDGYDGVLMPLHRLTVGHLLCCGGEPASEKMFLPLVEACAEKIGSWETYARIAARAEQLTGAVFGLVDGSNPN